MSPSTSLIWVWGMVLLLERQPHPLPSFTSLLPSFVSPLAVFLLICPSLLLRIFDSAACAGMCVYAFRVFPDCAFDCASDCVACARMCGNAVEAFVELHGHVQASVRHVPAARPLRDLNLKVSTTEVSAIEVSPRVARRRPGACPASCYPARAADAALRRQSGRRA